MEALYLDMTVLLGAAWLYIESFNSPLGQPVALPAGNELAGILAAHVVGRAAFSHQPFHHVNEIMGGERTRHMQSQALAVVLIEEERMRSRPPLSVRSATKSQLQTWLSLLARVEWCRRRYLGAGAVATTAPSAGQPPPRALHKLFAHLPALGPQHRCELAVAQPRVLA